MGRIPLEDLRDKQWLFALWGNVSSRQAIVERKRAKFEAEQAALAARAAEAAEAAEAAGGSAAANPDRQEGNKKTPDPSEKATDAEQEHATEIPLAIKEIAPDLCRALVLPADRPNYDRLDIADACADMMAFLSLATPMAAVITDKVKDMQGRFGQLRELEAQSVRSEAALH
ncbi:hypothetical protein POM88_000818 [Heracleum sosnowskyi]|uniref:Uncharacterized protein n=1 Tax=Heracleum sosnowskyi TaxID=360622 RepID=A0AAD8JCA2_9APIA|nr:hypothetical protein POM88_000818 [Heracleum sosnowskyi]